MISIEKLVKTGFASLAGDGKMEEAIKENALPKASYSDLIYSEGTLTLQNNFVDYASG